MAHKINRDEATKSFHANENEMIFCDDKDATKEYPQAKLGRFNNYANLSIRLDSDNCGNDFKNIDWEVSYTTNHITMESQYITVILTKVLDGRYEFESPEMNVIMNEAVPGLDELEGDYELYFTVKDKKATYYRQRPFTEYKQDIIAFWERVGVTVTESTIYDLEVYDTNGNLIEEQPIESMNSYLVKCDKRDNEYKTGTICRLDRPYMIDHLGNRTLNNIYIDKNEFIVTINKNALINFPVQHLAGATLGYTSAGSITSSTLGSLAYWTQKTATENGTATQISLYINPSASTCDVKANIYSKSGTTFTDMQNVENTDVGSGAGWENFTINQSITNGTTYAFGGRANATCSIARDDVGGVEYASRSTAYASFPETPVDLSIATGREYSIYITYTPSGGGPTNKPLDTIII